MLSVAVAGRCLPCAGAGKADKSSESAARHGRDRGHHTARTALLHGQRSGSYGQREVRSCRRLGMHGYDVGLGNGVTAIALVDRMQSVVTSGEAIDVDLGFTLSVERGAGDF